MPLSWNEIRDRAHAFVTEWKDETSEDAEAKSFWDGLFNVYGVPRRRVATFEEKVTKANRKDGFIDLLWKGKLLVEHKSAGKDLTRAYNQAKDYFPGLKDSELPRYIVVSNFERFRIYDLEKNDEPIEFALKDLPKNIKHLGFIAGYNKTQETREEDPVNIKAAEMMGRLHDKLKEIGYTGHQLEVYLVRLVFCLFADDTTIFEENTFEELLKQTTSEDGRDLADRLSVLFEVLNTPEDKRFKNLDEHLAAFPYVNGKLFEERLPPASFDSSMRQMLLDATSLNWGSISPAIFGSLFQSVMDSAARRNLGAHYTSEKNILKLIKPLFLDELREEFETIKKNKKKLEAFHAKLGTLRFFDPACGCGNFLVITYRELRRLEIDVLQAIYPGGKQLPLSLSDATKVRVNQFFGIELEEFPQQIAIAAMWLVDHQMNMIASDTFGDFYRNLPLKQSAHIVCGNALRIDWDNVVPNKYDDVFVIGNPPFGGKHLQSDEQKQDMEFVCYDITLHASLDFVSAWYIKAARFIQGTHIRCALVATNSIVQGEQVGILWSYLLRKGIKIHFAHRTFKWTNEAKGQAAVFCVIIGFGNFDLKNKRIYEYERPNSDEVEIKAKNISPYLIDCEDIIVMGRGTPICNVPDMLYGNKPADGGYLILSNEEYEKIKIEDERVKKFIKPLISAHEYLNGELRWCLWLKDVEPSEIRNIPFITERTMSVKKFRLASTKASTRELASTPSLFAEIRQPSSDYILIPRHSSENRKYVPFSVFSKNDILHDSSTSVPNASLYHLAVLTSTMHMAWMRAVCGRLKSDYRYSNNLVYNNYPWPASPSETQKKKVESAAQGVLDARAAYPNSTLADLYDPLAMPKPLLDAHKKLDAAVDSCYRKAPFTSELERLEYLFGMYKELTKDLFTKEKKKKRK